MPPAPLCFSCLQVLCRLSRWPQGCGVGVMVVTLCRKGRCSSGWGCLARRTAPKGQLRTPGRVQLYLVVVLNSALSQNNSPWRRRPAELPRMGVACTALSWEGGGPWGRAAPTAQLGPQGSLHSLGEQAGRLECVGL